MCNTMRICKKISSIKTRQCKKLIVTRQPGVFKMRKFTRANQYCIYHLCSIIHCWVIKSNRCTIMHVSTLMCSFHTLGSQTCFVLRCFLKFIECLKEVNDKSCSSCYIEQRSEQGCYMNPPCYESGPFADITAQLFNLYLLLKLVLFL